MRALTRLGVLATTAACACGSTTGTSGSAAPRGESAPMTDEDKMMMGASKTGGDPESQFGPLEVGADYASYVRVTDAPFLSAVHGNRWVHVYVNQIGAKPYVQGGEIPIGTKIVKVSWQDDHGKPSAVAGPIYVMEKRAAGYAPDHDDWYYAIHWAQPTGRFKAGGPIYWRGHSPRAAYCWDCHDGYDRSLGGLTPSSLLPR